MSNAAAIIIGSVLTAVIGGMVTLMVKFQITLKRRVEEVHVLVNSNLTAVTNALAHSRDENDALMTEIATLKGEPPSTPTVEEP